jgi:D-alanyl-D-alanine carboxypeptidase
VNPTWAGSAGEIISTTRDLDTFLDALLDGELLPAGLLAEMRDALPIGPTDGYGLGLQTLDAGDQCGGVYEGHTGGMHGYQSFLFSNGDKQFTMSLTVGDADIEDPATAERLSVALNNVLVAALCDGAQARTPLLVPRMAA